MVKHDHEMPEQCALVREEFSALLDNELPPGARAEVDAHLTECAPCLRALDGMKKVSDLYATLPRVGAPEDFEARVRRAVRPGLLRFPALSGQGWTALAAAAGTALIAGTYFLLVAERPSTRSQLAMQAEMRSTSTLESAGGAPEKETLESRDASAPSPAPTPAPEAAAMTLMKAAPDTSALEEASPAPEPADDARVRWEVAGRTLFLTGNAWVEQGGTGVNTVDVDKDSREFLALVEKFPELMELAAAEIPVVFQTGDRTWYRLLPKKN